MEVDGEPAALVLLGRDELVGEPRVVGGAGARFRGEPSLRGDQVERERADGERRRSEPDGDEDAVVDGEPDDGRGDGEDDAREERSCPDAVGIALGPNR